MTRLALLEAIEPTVAWEHTTGLWSLLQYARALPAREPLDLDELQDSGMGTLLREARLRQQKEHG